MRATAFNQKYALLMGVSVRKIFSLAWVFASVVASIGGIFLAGMVHISPEMSYIGLKVFPAVILGGIDSIAGAMVGKKAVPPGLGTFPTDGPTFVALLVSVILVVGALTFFPALSLGPVLEHFAVLGGRVF